MNVGYKVCPNCRQHGVVSQAPFCPQCGYQFPQTFAPPPQAPPQAFYAQQPGVAPVGVPSQDLSDMARRFLDSRQLCIITFFVGLFCLWPVWIISYLEYDKMRKIKEDVARMGVDVRWWQGTYGCRDVI